MSFYFRWKTLCDFQECPNSLPMHNLKQATDKNHIFFPFLVQIRCHECMLLAFQHPLAIFELKTLSQIFIFGPRVFVGAVRQDNFCACKQYLLTENLSDEGLGRIFWIADIPMSSPPILSDLCPPSLRLCPSMPSKSQVKSIIVLSVSTSTVHHPPSVKLKSIFSHPSRLQPPRFVL